MNRLRRLLDTYQDPRPDSTEMGQAVQAVDIPKHQWRSVTSQAAADTPNI